MNSMAIAFITYMKGKTKKRKKVGERFRNYHSVLRHGTILLCEKNKRAKREKVKRKKPTQNTSLDSLLQVLKPFRLLFKSFLLLSLMHGTRAPVH